MKTYEQRYKEALERAKIWKEKSGMPKDKQGILDDIFPELKKIEHEEFDPITQIEFELTRLEKEVSSNLSSFRNPEGCDSTYTYWVGKSESLEEIRSFIRNLRRTNYIYDAEWKSSLEGKINESANGNVTVDLGIPYKYSKLYRGQPVKIILQEE